MKTCEKEKKHRLEKRITKMNKTKNKTLYMSKVKKKEGNQQEKYIYV